MAAPPQLHNPPPIADEDFECGRLKPLSYSPEAISDALIKYISPGRCHDWSKFSVRQRRAITKFQGQGTWNLGNPDNIDDIKKYFEIFDDAFFGGLLKGFCKLELIATPWIIRREGRSSEGLCRRYFPGKERDPRYKLEKPYVVITLEDEMYDQRSMRHYKPTQRIQIYLAALLHEMSHAIFDIYCCQCNKGCRQKTMREATPGGHHLSWQRAAQAIEVVDQGIPKHTSYLLGLLLDLGREAGLVGDLLLGYPMPDDKALKSLAFDKQKLSEQLKESQSRVDERERRLKREIMPFRYNRCLREEWTVDCWEKKFGQVSWEGDRDADVRKASQIEVWKDKTIDTEYKGEVWWPWDCHHYPK